MKNTHVEDTKQANNTKTVTHKQDNDNEMEKWELVPPDGGWGWLVLLGATVVNLLIPGTIKSFGVLFVEYLEVFNAPPYQAAWIPAICYFLYSSLGPLSSILSIRYSYKTVTLIGGAIAALGMILSFFATSVSYLCLSYGVMVGTGAGLCFPPTVYIVTSYFVKFRGVANGVCISGSSIGSIILPPFLRLLLEIYGYRGAVLIMGGITLHCWVAALLYEPVEKHNKRVRVKVPESEEAKPAVTGETPMFYQKDDAAELENFLPRINCVDGKVEETRSTVAMQSTSSITLQMTPGTSRNLEKQKTKKPVRSPSISSFQYVSTPYHGSTLTLQPEIIASSFSLKAPAEVQKREEKISSKKCFDFSVLKNPIFLIILISNSTNAISYTNFTILLPSYALQLGFDKTKAALLLSVVSSLDLVGRIGGAALSDATTFPKEWYFISGLLVSGISLALLPLAATYTELSICCAIFGLASGIYIGITAVIMAHLLGTEKLQSTYGISLFLNGVLQLIGPPLCGVFYEQINSYVPIFSSLGVILIIGASLWGIVPFLNKETIQN